MHVQIYICYNQNMLKFGSFGDKATKTSFKRLATAGVILLVLAVPTFTLAFDLPGAEAPSIAPAPISNSSLGTPEGVQNFLNDMLTWLSRIFWIVAVFFIIFAGFTYLTSAGDEAKVDKAKGMLKYAVIGIAVALLATVLPYLIESFLL